MAKERPWLLPDPNPDDHDGQEREYQPLQLGTNAGQREADQTSGEQAPKRLLSENRPNGVAAALESVHVVATPRPASRSG